MYEFLWTAHGSELTAGYEIKYNKKDQVVFTFVGDGGTSEGDFHEALNVASVWSLPVLFCVENNGYGLSTPTSEQYNCKDLADRAVGYGMESHIIDGNNILEVFTKISKITADMRKNPRPVLIEFKTFRMRGHEEASGTKYVPQELMEAWEEKDPIVNFENFLSIFPLLDEPQGFRRGFGGEGLYFLWRYEQCELHFQEDIDI